MALELKLAQSYGLLCYQSIIYYQYAYSLQSNPERFSKTHARIFHPALPPDPLIDTLGLAPCQRWNLIAGSMQKIPPRTHEHIHIHCHTVHLKAVLLLAIL